MARTARIGRDQIVQAALDVLDERGLAGLTMRTLAQRVGVQAASLYNHVSGRDELQQLITDTVWSSVLADLGGADDWRELLQRLAVGIRSALREHPGATQVVAVTNLSEQAYAASLPLMRRAFAGLADEQESALIVSTLGVLAIGLAAAEFGDAPHPSVAPREYYDQWFDLAVGAFLDGIALRMQKGR